MRQAPLQLNTGGPSSTGEPERTLKVIFAGASGVGKTSLLLRYTDKKFSDETSSTIGIDFRIKEVRVDNKWVKCHIWDTAGQEKFQGTVKPFFRKSHVVFYVFDPHKPESLQHLLDHYVNDPKICSLLTPNTYRAFVATKTDISLPEGTEAGVSSVLSAYEMSLFWTSAKENTNIDAIFEAACRHCLYHEDDVVYTPRTTGGTEEDVLNLNDEINIKVSSSCC
jgi:Ras-related protein Rab-18